MVLVARPFHVRTIGKQRAGSLETEKMLKGGALLAI
jgi:hypothetical protein